MTNPNQNQPNSSNQPYPPPYGYPYPPYPYPSYPNNPQNSQDNSKDKQTPPPQAFPYPPPYGYPYPYPPPTQQGGNSQPNAYPYPPYPYPPYPYPPPNQENQQQSGQPQFPYPYPPYPYPPYPYPPAQQQPQPQQPQQSKFQFDWERGGLPSQSLEPTQTNSNRPAPVFDWEKGNKDEPQQEITIDWNYKSEYDVPEVPPDIQREPSVAAICTSKAFDPSILPQLDDSFYKIFPSDVQLELLAQKRRKTFQSNRSARKETFRIKFQFNDDQISDLTVSATFHVKEYTCCLYDFLNEFVFKEGTKFVIRDPIGKQIGCNHNQQLEDVKITGNMILSVKISHYTGIKDEVNDQYMTQKKAIEEEIAKLEAKKKEAQQKEEGKEEQPKEQ